ncbi:MAG: hypothetical protein HC932_04550 [Thermales bacterium]|nr:hypothetical protein [Thermales bacterium]
MTMNSIPNSDLSLYQLIKNSNPSPLSIGISPQTLQSYIETITDTLIDWQLKATILIKPPQSQSWSYLTKKYQKKVI